MDKLLLEYPWISKMVSQSKEYGLDWLMMSCLALELSKGDPRCRMLDREFMLEHMGPDCPLVAARWSNGVPDIQVQDECTRWGLFQILGRVAIDKGLYSGRLINFIEAGSNIRAACILAQDILQKDDSTVDDVILYFGANPRMVYALMEESRASVSMLLEITDITIEDDIVEETADEQT